MNEIIETFVKKIRERNNIGEEEIKKFSKEFCQIMRDCQIIDKLNDLEFLQKFFGIEIEYVKDNIRSYRIRSRCNHFSKEKIAVLYIKEKKGFSGGEKNLALKYAIMFYFFRLKDKTEVLSPQEINFEIPILESTKLSTGEKIFLYNLIIPCDKFIKLYKDYWTGLYKEDKKESDSCYELTKQWITFLQINAGITAFTTVKIEEFFHDAFFDDLKKVTQTQTS